MNPTDPARMRLRVGRDRVVLVLAAAGDVEHDHALDLGREGLPVLLEGEIELHARPRPDTLVVVREEPAERRMGVQVDGAHESAPPCFRFHARQVIAQRAGSSIGAGSR